ncbi:MAG: CotH kinase family protein [Flavobacteriales bacterium]
MQRALLTAATVLLALPTARAQSGTQLFRNDVVHEIRLTITEPAWAATLWAWHSNGTDNSLMATVAVDGTALDSIGVRMRGNGTFVWASTPKKPFKLDFNYFLPDQRYDGLRSVNMNNDLFDASHIHNAVCFKMLNDFGVAAPRTGYANLFINDTLYGLYSLAEQINKNFTGERFQNNDGDLWKAIYCNWQYVGSDTNLYTSQLEPKDAYDGQAWDRLLHVFEMLGTTAFADLDDSLDAVMEMDDFLKTYAVNAATFANDNAANNWWLYWDNDSGRYRYIPWDYDLAFFGNSTYPFTEDTTQIFSWWSTTQLAKAVIRNPDLKARYYDHLCRLRADIFTPQHLYGFIDSAYVLLQPHALNDVMDLFDGNDFDSAYFALNTDGTGEFWGVRPYIDTQGAIIDSVLIAKQVNCSSIGIAEVPEQQELQLFPVPMSDRAVLVLPKGSALTSIEIRDQQGRLMRTRSVAGETFTIERGALEPGAYSIRCVDGSMRAVRFIVL